MNFRALSAGFFLAAIFGVLAAAILFRPDAAARLLAVHVESSELRPDKAGGWEYYADPEAVRRNSMDRQRQAMSGPLVEHADAELRRFTVVAVPLAVIALVSGIAWTMLGRRDEDAPAPPSKPPRKKRPAAGRG